MIIELFGAAGAGKTTFAHALSANLQDQGHVVKVFLSYRPAEPSPAVPPCAGGVNRPRAAAVARRLIRPAAEMLALARHPVANSHDLIKAATLVGLLPPKQMVWTLRMSQYIVRLSHAWRQASQADHIVVFDQAFVQAVCSLVSFHDRKPDEALIAEVLEHIPKSDLLIRLDAPRETLKARLYDRVRRQSRIERLFELHQDTNLGSMHLIDLVHEQLRQRGRSVMRVASLDQRSLHDSVREVGRQINLEIGRPADGSAGKTHEPKDDPRGRLPSELSDESHRHA
jgi:thymidylate kinase